MQRVFSGAAAAVLAAALCWSNPVRAETGGISDTGPHQRGQMISVWGTLPWAYGFGFGVGGRYTIPLVNDGPIPTINNSLELEPGIDVNFINYGYDIFGVSYSTNYTELDIPVELRWTFHLTPHFDLYPKFGLGLAFRFASSNVAGTPFANTVNLYWDLGGGLLYWFNDAIALRAEIGYSGLHVGVGFKL